MQIMILVGICGPIGSGKTTFAQFLTEVDSEHSLHLETSGVVTELANIFNTELHKRLETLLSEANLVPLSNELIETLLPHLSEMARETISIDMVQITAEDFAAHPDWYEKLFVYLQQAKADPTIIDVQVTIENKNNYRPLLQWIGGYFLYRLNNRLLWYEELLRRAEMAGPNIQIVAMTAPRQPKEAEFVQNAGGKVLKIIRPGLISDNTDLTERHLAEIVPDVTIQNDGTLTDLQSLAEKIHTDLLSGTLGDSYSARTITH
jgi:hypothetical protein